MLLLGLHEGNTNSIIIIVVAECSENTRFLVFSWKISLRTLVCAILGYLGCPGVGTRVPGYPGTRGTHVRRMHRVRIRVGPGRNFFAFASPGRYPARGNGYPGTSHTGGRGVSRAGMHTQVPGYPSTGTGTGTQVLPSTGMALS